MLDKRGAALLVVLLGAAFQQSLSVPAGYNEQGLPEYCHHVQKGSLRTKESTEYYSAIFGREEFHAMHHYCWALWYHYEALKIHDNPVLRRNGLFNAVENHDYVLERSDEDFILRPEILVMKGAALIDLEHVREGLACYQEALELRPDFLPAYVAMSNYFIRAGEVDEAKRVLRSGLARLPDAGLLKRKLAELGEPAGNR